jgi:hypothetical protein
MELFVRRIANHSQINQIQLIHYALNLKRACYYRGVEKCKYR